MTLLPDMVGITVQDMGLALAIPEGQDGEAYVEFITPNGYRISWNTVAMVKEIDPSWQEPTGYRMGLAFKCDSPGCVDTAYAAIVAAGHPGHKEPWDAFWGQRYAVVTDPDGNNIDLFAPLS